MAKQAYVSEGHIVDDDGNLIALDSDTLHALESAGAAVDQTAARTLEERVLQYIRDAGSGAPPSPTWHYLGGDMTDVVYVPGSDDSFWIFADGFDGTTVTNDFYGGTPLPQRNGAITAPDPDSFVGATQLFVSGTSGLWIDAVTQGGFASHHWWPIGLIDDAGTYRAICWRVTDGTTPHGNLVDTDIVTLAFGVYNGHAASGFGAQTDNFWAAGGWRDTTHTYVWGMQFVPPFDAQVTGTSLPNYILGDPENHYTKTRLGRVTNGQLLTFANWEFWNGSAWVSGVANAAPLLDADGREIHGDAGIRKIGTGQYLLAAHRLMDSHLDVYRSITPQGPWTQISRVPLPTQGHLVNGPSTYQVGQLVKILPAEVQAPPAEHSIAIISRNTIVPTVGYSAEDAFTLRNIRRYAPQFAVIPHI